MKQAIDIATSPLDFVSVLNKSVATCVELESRAAQAAQKLNPPAAV